MCVCACGGYVYGSVHGLVRGGGGENSYNSHCSSIVNDNFAVLISTTVYNVCVCAYYML